MTKDKTREEKLRDQYEAERKMAEEWDGATSGGIFSVGKADRIVTSHHEEIRDMEQVAARWEEPVIMEAQTPVPPESERRKGNVLGVALVMLIAIMFALMVMALCSERFDPPPIPVGPEGTQ